MCACSQGKFGNLKQRRMRSCLCAEFNPMLEPSHPIRIRDVWILELCGQSQASVVLTFKCGECVSEFIIANMASKRFKVLFKFANNLIYIFINFVILLLCCFDVTMQKRNVFWVNISMYFLSNPHRKAVKLRVLRFASETRTNCCGSVPIEPNR